MSDTLETDNPWDAFPRRSAPTTNPAPLPWEAWVVRHSPPAGTGFPAPTFLRGRAAAMPDSTQPAVETTRPSVPPAGDRTAAAPIEAALDAARRRHAGNPERTVDAFLALPGVSERLTPLMPGKLGAKIQREFGITLKPDELSVLGVLIPQIRARSGGGGAAPGWTPNTAKQERRRLEEERRLRLAEEQRAEAERRRVAQIERWRALVAAQPPDQIAQEARRTPAFAAAIGFQWVEVDTDEDGLPIRRAAWQPTPLVQMDVPTQEAVFAAWARHEHLVDQAQLAADIRSERAELAAKTRRHNEMERAGQSRKAILPTLAKAREGGPQALAELAQTDARIEWLLRPDAYGNPALATLTPEEAAALAALRPRGRGLIKSDVLARFSHIKPSELEVLYTDSYLPHMGYRTLRTVHGTVQARLYDEAALSRMTPTWMDTWRALRTAGKRKA